MFTTSRALVETLTGIFFLIVAAACLLWPEKFYEHALRPVYREPDGMDEQLEKVQRRGYVWNVRIIGVIAAIMFTFIVIHLMHRPRAPHRGAIGHQPSATILSTRDKAFRVALGGRLL